jgi:2,4-dienoyl-CoA reductase-like NADH-dependent reductase (Old Yellow Enzyme family)
MSKLFQETAIGNLLVPNRFVRSATWAGMATEDGQVTEGLIMLMERLAKGKVGLIMTGHAYVHPAGKAGPWQLGIYDDSQIPGLERMAARMHEHGSRTCCQIAHSGVQGAGQVLDGAPKGPSAMKNAFGDQGEAMTVDEIKEAVQAFAKAASRAQEAGYDAVQLHAAHGYLISEFLSPFFNKRDDEYGGSLENRSRLLMEAYRAVREAVGPRYPVLIKINCRDFTDPEFTPEEMIEVCKRLVSEGLDGVEMSGGNQFAAPEIPVRKGKAGRESEAWYLEYAEAFKKECGVPLMLVGGVRSYGKAEKLVEDGDADFISMARPLIREPGLIKRWKEGDLDDAKCISCNSCFKGVTGGRGLYCLIDAGEVGREEAMKE